VLAGWGGLEEVRTAGAGAPTAEVRVYLEKDGKRLHVGTLWEEAHEYVFRYSREFKEQTQVPPISAFPDVGDEYRSSVLWPFFRVRLPPTSREDVKKVMTDRGIDETDVLRLLGVIGRRSIATPYELELHAASA
jgi:HipA-like protein